MVETYNGKTPQRMRPTPGTKLFLTLPTLPVRAQIEVNGRGFVVAGNTLYEIYSNGTSTVRGVITNNGNPISIDTNGIQLILVDGQRGWGYDLTSNRLAQIGDPVSFTGSIAADGTLTVTAISSGVITKGKTITGVGIPADTTIDDFGTGNGGVGTYKTSTTTVVASTTITQQVTSSGFYPTKTIKVFGGYAIGVRLDTQQFIYSDLFDVFTWLPLDFSSAELIPDNLLTVAEETVGLFMLGTKSLEVFTQTSDPVNVFQRRAGYSTSFGCAAIYSVLTVKSGVMWIGRDADGSGVVYRSSAGVPAIVSNTAVADAIRNAGDSIANAVAYSYEQSGRTFYCLNIPNVDTTFVYDISEQQWHERRTYTPGYAKWGRHKADNHMFIFNQNIVGSYDSGDLFVLDNDYRFDDDLVIRRVRVMTPIYDEDSNKYGTYNSFGLDCIVGTAYANPPYDDPQIGLETSDDNGITYGNIRLKSLGKRGKREQQIIWNRCGYSRSRVFRITTSAPVDFAIHRAWVV